jgi:Family of unknown function (DUF5681)
MQFHKGQSGNPAGRPRGSRNRASTLVHSLLAGEVEEVARKAIEMAKEGDMAAIRVCLDRIAPPRKYDAGCCELPQIENAADAVKAMKQIVDAVSAGDLAPTDALALAKVVEIYLQAFEAIELEERIAKCEQDRADRPKPDEEPCRTFTTLSPSGVENSL